MELKSSARRHPDEVARADNGQILLGFAAETNDLLATHAKSWYARAWMQFALMTCHAISRLRSRTMSSHFAQKRSAPEKLQVTV